MSKLQYNVKTVAREARPRSERLRALGISANVASTSLSGQGGDSATYEELKSLAHSHANKTQLDALSFDADYYMYIKQQDADEDEATAKKIKAGYADTAHDLDTNSPVYHAINEKLSKVEEDTAAEKITFEKGLRAVSTATEGAADGVVELDANEETESDAVNNAITELTASCAASTLGELENVAAEADELPSEDKVLVKLAGDDTWTLKNLSELGSGGGQSRYVVRLNRTEDSGTIIAINKNVTVNIRYTSQLYDPSTQTSADTGDSGILTIETQIAGGTEWIEKAVRSINSVSSTGTASTKIDLSEYIIDGQQTVRMFVRDPIAGVSSIYLGYDITVTELSLEYVVPWTVPYSNVSSSLISIPFHVKGIINKTLHVAMYDNSGNIVGTAQEYALGTDVYTGRTYNVTLPHPNVHGVYEIRSYLSFSDEQQTETITIQIMAITSFGTNTLVAVNQIPKSKFNNITYNWLTNWAQNTLLKYAVYNPLSSASDLVFALKNSNASATYLTINESNRANRTEYTLTAQLEIDEHDSSGTPTNYFNALLTVSDDAGNTLRDSITYYTDNSNNFAPAAGATFILNPKTRSNSDSDRSAIINAATGTAVAGSAFTGMKFSADGWIVDSDGSKCLRVFAGSNIAIPYESFSNNSTLYGLTIEVDFATRNIIDEAEAVLQMCSVFAADGKPLGFVMYPKVAHFYSTNNRNTLYQDVEYQEDVRTHVAVNIICSQTRGNYTVNLVRIFVNGVINREIAFKSGADSFWQNNSSGGIRIGSSSCDIDVYGIRIYKDKFLDESDIRQDYMSAIPSIASKLAYRAANDIVGNNGEINYNKATLLYNTLVWYGDVPDKDHKSAGNGNLEINIIGDNAHSGMINNMNIKGQGTSSKLYWKWNHQYGFSSDSKWTSKEGTEIGAYYCLTADSPRATKLVAKLNWASSMQTHKMGACRAFNDLWREVTGGSSITALSGYENTKIAVLQKPFLYFVKTSADSEPEFYGLMTFGAGKGDKLTFGYDKNNNSLKDYLMIEGSSQTPVLTLCHAPWFADEVTYSEDDEGWFYNSQQAFDYDLGNLNSIVYFIAAHNFVYANSVRISQFIGSLAQLQESTNADKSRQYWTTDSATRYNLYRYDHPTRQWVNAGVTKTAGAYDTVNLATDLNITLPATPSDWDAINETFIAARMARFRASAGNYFHTDDMLYCMQYLKLIAASDNRAKNTYLYVDPVTHKIRCAQDDLDTIFSTNNQGQKQKPYYVEEHDVIEGTDTTYWAASHNAMYDTFEAAYPSELRTTMYNIFAAMVKLCGSITQFWQTYFFNAQEYIPAVAYNVTAKLLYEMAKPLYDLAPGTAGRYENDTDPITQSTGDSLQSEREWIKNRSIYIASYAMYKEGLGDRITFRANQGSSSSYNFKLTPAIWMYMYMEAGENKVFPAGASGTSMRVRAGVQATIPVPVGGTSQVIIFAIDYMKDIGPWYDMYIDGSFALGGKRLTEWQAGKAQLENGETVQLSISKLISLPENLRVLNIANVTSLAGLLDLTSHTRLTSLNAGGSALTRVLLPEYSDVTTLHLPASITSIKLVNQPQLASGFSVAGLENITQLWLENVGFDAVAFVQSILAVQGNHLSNIRLIGVSGRYDNLSVIAALARLGGIDQNGDAIASPVVTGNITVNTAYEDEYNPVCAVFTQLVINATAIVMRFASAATKRAIVQSIDANGNDEIDVPSALLGLTLDERLRLQQFSLKNYPTVDYFNEFTKFSSVNLIAWSATIQNKHRDVTTIKEIALPAGFRILYGDFMGCSGLCRIDISKTLNFVDGEQIQGLQFKNCTALQVINIPSSWAGIGAECFMGCTSLSSATIADSGITTINDRAFQDCNLSTITIPAAITAIGKDAFLNNANLAIVVMQSTTPPALVAWGAPFNNCSADLKIYVPSTALSAYQNASIWNTYAAIMVGY